MTEMPERIWADASGADASHDGAWWAEYMISTTEYIRADKVADFMADQAQRMADRTVYRTEFASRDEQLHGGADWCGTDGDWDVQP